MENNRAANGGYVARCGCVLLWRLLGPLTQVKVIDRIEMMLSRMKAKQPEMRVGGRSRTIEGWVRHGLEP